MFSLSVGGDRQQKNILVSSIGPASISAQPGSIVTVSFSVINKRSVPQIYDAASILPPGWKQIIRETSFSVPPSQKEVRLITFSVPSDAPAGKYTVHYTVQDREAVVQKSSAAVSVTVSRFNQLEVSVFRSPQFVVAGNAFTTDVLVTNQGNAMVAVRLYCRSSHAYPVQTDSLVVHLRPKEIRHVYLSVLTAAQSELTDHTLEVNATLIDDETVSERVSGVVKIIQRMTTTKDEYLEYPVVARIREVEQNGRFRMQGELSGSGSLNEQRTDRFEFLFRSPETQSISVLGQRDEYRISYRTDNSRLYAGDQNYSLSPLTELGRTATGIGGAAVFGKYDVGGFYNETRWMSPRQKEAGGYIRYAIIKDASIGINYLSISEQTSSDIATVRGLFTPISGSDVDIELGTGKTDGKPGSAVSARIEGTQHWISYDLRYIQAEPHYGGYYRDMNFISASLNARATRDLRIQSYMRVENRNIAHDTSLGNAPHESHYQIGAGFSDYLFISYRYIGREDALHSVAYRNREDAVQSRVGYNFPKTSVSAIADVGTRRNQRTAEVIPFKHFAMYSNMRPSGRQNYGISLEYEMSRDTINRNSQQRFSANVNARILFGSSTQLQLYMYGSRLIASQVLTQALMEASVEYVFPFNHTARIRGRVNRVTPTSIPNDVAVAIEYTIPIAVPFKRITAHGQLRGSLTDEAGNGIADILVSVGDKVALSDAHGSFYFSSLKPGSVYLIVDNASIGFLNTTSQPMPMELLIRGGEESKVALVVCRSAVVSGNVTQFVEKDPDILNTSVTLIEIGKRTDVFIELSNKNEIHRRVTDNRGNFIFKDVRPGRWNLKVTGGNIPEYQVVDPDSISILLAPGAKSNVKIRIHPAKRTLKML